MEVVTLHSGSRPNLHEYGWKNSGNYMLADSSLDGGGLG